MLNEYAMGSDGRTRGNIVCGVPVLGAEACQDSVRLDMVLKDCNSMIDEGVPESHLGVAGYLFS
jgi:hypothetical protein